MRCVKCFFIIVFLIINNISFADEVFHFGVLAFRPKDIAAKQWRPLANELERVLGKKVELLVLTYPELDQAAQDKKLDFVLTNPEHYILLKNKIAISPVATMITLDNGHPMTHFAGVIFTRNDRDDIQNLYHLNNKTIASPAKSSLGGYLMQRWELEKHNIKAKEYLFIGMPHDKTVAAVLSKKVDAGFVRSGVLENLAREGKISLTDIKVLREHYIPDGEKIPLLHSTEHYPEWSFSVAQSVNSEITRKVSITLLKILPDSEVAKSAGIAGFNAPADYTSVEVLMLRLRSHPEELKYFDLFDVFWRYREFFVIFTAIILLILTLVLFLIRANLKFKKLANENKKLLLAVEQSPVSVVVTDLQTNIEYVNQHFLKSTGYSQAEILNKKVNLLRLSRVNKTVYKKLRKTLKEGNEWRGEIISFRKDGSEYIELTLITPVRQSNGKISHYLAIKQDITERKNAEEQIRKLAFYDPLTGLANRRKLLDHLNYLIAVSQRGQQVFAVLMMDLDKFKSVNDALGHAAGDELLKQVAERISPHLRTSDIVARLGGDEFVIVLNTLHKPEDAAQVALKVIDDLTMSFTLAQKHIVQIGASIGISFYPQHGNTPEALLDHADTALYRAKDSGRGRFACFD